VNLTVIVPHEAFRTDHTVETYFGYSVVAIEREDPLMHKISVHDAENQLRRLMDEVDQGEEVVITRSDGASFKLVPLSKGKPRPTFGSAEGAIRMSEDFDAPLDDFEDYMPS